MAGGVIGNRFLEIHPRLAGTFLSDLNRGVVPALQKTQRAYETGASASVASARKVTSANATVQASTLRVVAAQERLNLVQATGKASAGELASAQASLITAQNRLAIAQDRAAVAQKRTIAGAVPAARSGIGGTVALLGGVYAATKLFGAFRDGVHQAEDLQRATTQTNVVLAATGHVAGVSRGHIHDLAEEISHYSGIIDTDLQRAENQLLQSTHIRGGFFDATLKASADMAVAVANARGTTVDLASSAKALGLAMQDPANGLSRLRRAGLAFTAEQKDEVKTLVDSGRAQEARAKILEFVNARVAGSARNFGRTTAGEFAKAHDAEVRFTRGMATDFLPTLTDVAQKGAGALEFLGQHDELRKLTGDAAAAAGGLLILRKGSELLTKSAEKMAAAELAAAAAKRESALASKQLADADTLAAGAETKLAGASTEAAAADAARGGLRARALGGLGSRLTRAGGIFIGGQIAADLVGGPTGHVLSDAASGAAIGSFAGPIGTGVGALAGATYGAFTTHENVASELFGKVANDLRSKYNDDPNFRGAVANDLSLQAQVLHIAPDLRSKIEGDQAKFGRNPVVPRSQTQINAATSALNVDARRIAGVRKRIRETAANTVDTGLFAEIPKPPHVDLRGLSDSVANAQDRVANAQDRLNVLRHSGTATTEQLAAAERSLAGAHRAVEGAQRRLEDGQKKANERTALSAKEVLRRANFSSGSAVSQLHAERTLLHRGLDLKALPQITALEESNRGTAKRLAKTLTDGEIEGINETAARRLHALIELANLANKAQWARMEAMRREHGRRLARAQLQGEIDEGNLDPRGGIRPTATPTSSGPPIFGAPAGGGNIIFTGPVNDVAGVTRAHRNHRRRRALTGHA